MEMHKLANRTVLTHLTKHGILKGNVDDMMEVIKMSKLDILEHIMYHFNQFYYKCSHSHMPATRNMKLK